MEVQLSGSSMDELRDRVRSRYGPEARIVSAEVVTVGGIKGYLARRHFEVTVNVPAPQHRGSPGVRSRAGIAALLEEADKAESVAEPVVTPLVQDTRATAVSTRSGGFDAFVRELAKSTGSNSENAIDTRTARQSDARGRRDFRVPRPGRHPGDLTVVVGLEDDALSVCLEMACDADVSRGAGQSDGVPRGVYTGGKVAVEGYLPLGNRAGAVAARAAGVEGGYPVFVAWGINPGLGWDRPVDELTGLGADQVWVAVDARRKPTDTASWVDGVRASCSVDAMAVKAIAGTASPATVNSLGIPIGWVDGLPAHVTVL